MIDGWNWPVFSEACVLMGHRFRGSILCTEALTVQEGRVHIWDVVASCLDSERKWSHILHLYIRFKTFKKKTTDIIDRTVFSELAFRDNCILLPHEGSNEMSLFKLMCCSNHLFFVLTGRPAADRCLCNDQYVCSG